MHKSVDAVLNTMIHDICHGSSERSRNGDGVENEERGKRKGKRNRRKKDIYTYSC